MAKTPTKGADSIKGTAGNDNIDSLAGNDTISGLAGNDTLNGNLGNDSIDGGNGDDQLLGGDGNDTLFGSSGNDSLKGEKGNDSLDGGVGNDILDGGVGKDTMSGGEGNDTYYVNDAKDMVTESTKKGTGGNDTVISTSLTYNLDVAGYVENLTLLNLQGDVPAGKVNSGTGNKANNVITGNIADNLLKGLDGNDTLNGGDGADTLDGGKGKDVLNGGAGDDVYYMNNEGDKITDEEGSLDEIIAQNVSYDITTSDFIEVLTLSGAKALTGTGNEADNLIQEVDGGTANNTLIGAAGNDTIDGSGGDDELNGGAGNDSLIGGDGDDTAVYNGDASDYQVTPNPDAPGAFAIEYIGSNPENEDEGIDELISIEHLQFADGTQDVEEAVAASAGGDMGGDVYDEEPADGDTEGGGTEGDSASLASLIELIGATPDYSLFG